MATTIALRGKEKGDFAYYLAKSLACNKYIVAVIDNSYSKDLFEAIHKYEDDSKTLEKENIVYIRDAEVSDDFLEKFDFVIYYLGQNESDADAEYVFVMPDYTRTSIRAAKDLGEELLQDAYFIFRDKVSTKISERNIARELGVNDEKILGYLPLNEKDESAYMSFSYEGKQSIKGTSKDMQYAIITVLSIVTEEDFSTVKKYYRKAKCCKTL